MISQNLIQTVQEFAYGQAKEYSAPLLQLILMTNEQGQRLAKQLGANEKIVLLGTLLMDCQLEKAISENKLNRHTEMGVSEALKILQEDKDITAEESENIINCIKNHHGSSKFFSIESEICCNADCYKFASIEGFILYIRYAREMPLEQLLELTSVKADEKWNALSLDICKQELEAEYGLIKKMLIGVGNSS